MACVWSRAVQSHTDVGACITVYKKYVEEEKKVWRDGFIYSRIGFVIARREATVLLGAMCDSSWFSVVVLVAVVAVLACVRLCLHLSGISSVYVFIYTQTTRTSWKVPNNPFMSFPFF